MLHCALHAMSAFVCTSLETFVLLHLSVCANLCVYNNLLCAPLCSPSCSATAGSSTTGAMANAAFTAAAAAQDTATPVEVPSLPDDLACAQYSSTLRLVATATRSAADGIRVWSYTTGRIEHVLALIPPPPQPAPLQHSVAAVAAAAAAVAAAASALRTAHSSSSSNHTITSSTSSVSKAVNSSAVLCMAFLEPYALLAVARGDGVLQLWCVKGHAARGACVLEWENRAPRGSSFYGEAKSDYPLLQPKVSLNTRTWWYYCS
jgi:hypothetical protein